MHTFLFFAARCLLCLTLATFFVVAVWPDRQSLTVKAQQNNVVHPDIPTPPIGTVYRQTNLVSDWPGIALTQNPLLVNPWGISATAASPFWVVNTATSTSSLLTG